MNNYSTRTFEDLTWESKKEKKKERRKKSKRNCPK
jgi:hypothetical protein